MPGERSCDPSPPAPSADGAAAAPWQGGRAVTPVLAPCPCPQPCPGRSWPRRDPAGTARWGTGWHLQGWGRAAPCSGFVTQRGQGSMVSLSLQGSWGEMSFPGPSQPRRSLLLCLPHLSVPWGAGPPWWHRGVVSPWRGVTLARCHPGTVPPRWPGLQGSPQWHQGPGHRWWQAGEGTHPLFKSCFSLFNCHFPPGSSSEGWKCMGSPARAHRAAPGDVYILLWLFIIMSGLLL